MKIIKNESLKKYTTLKIGGVAENFYILETIDDIAEVLKQIGEEYYHVLANGSNLLINDQKTFKHVIYINKMEKILSNDNGIITVSASVKIQELMNFINKLGYGGIEYLYSVPSSVGGAVYMNAGRGKSFNKCISDYLVSVDIFDGKEIKTVSKEECQFEYRKSIFQQKNWIIVSAQFKFEEKLIEQSTKEKKERIEYSRNQQDAKQPNAGSVFKQANGIILAIIRKIGFGWKSGMQFSKKTGNWLNNNGKGTYKQAKFLIRVIIFLHRVTFQKIQLEYVVWE